MSNESSIFRKLLASEKQLKHIYDALLLDKSLSQSEKFLLQACTTKIDQVELKSRKSKRIRNILKIGVLALSGISTILLGLNTDILEKDLLKDIVLGITAMVTFLSALAVFWDIDNYWLRIKVMLNRLKALRYKYAFFLSQIKDSKETGQTDYGNTLKNKTTDNYMREYLEIIEDEYWEKLMKFTLDNQKNNDNTDPATATH
ncbi:MAG: SLATT domain-containing protein [Flavobacteriaceae bacterium]